MALVKKYARFGPDYYNDLYLAHYILYTYLVITICQYLTRELNSLFSILTTKLLELE